MEAVIVVAGFLLAAAGILYLAGLAGGTWKANKDWRRDHGRW